MEATRIVFRWTALAVSSGLFLFDSPCSEPIEGWGERSKRAIHRYDLSSGSQRLPYQSDNHHLAETTSTSHGGFGTGPPGCQPNRCVSKGATSSGDSFESEWDEKTTKADGMFRPEEGIFADDFEPYTSTEQVQAVGHWIIQTVGDADAAWQLKASDGYAGDLRRGGPDLEGVSGKYMISEGDMVYPVNVNESLISPEIDCSRHAEVTLLFATNIQVYGSEKAEILDVDVRAFDSLTQQWGEWQNVFRWDRTLGDTSSSQRVEISKFADGKKIRLKWHRYDANPGSRWAIDDVQVRGLWRAIGGVTISRSRGGLITLAWEPFGSGTYLIEGTDDLKSGRWLLSEKKVERPGCAVSWVLPEWPTADRMFYRIGTGAPSAP